MTSIAKTELEMREKLKLQRDSLMETKDKLIETKDKLKEKMVNTLNLARDNINGQAAPIPVKINDSDKL